MLLPVNIRSTTIYSIIREIKAETEVKNEIEIKI